MDIHLFGCYLNVIVTSRSHFFSLFSFIYFLCVNYFPILYGIILPLQCILSVLFKILGHLSSCHIPLMFYSLYSMHGQFKIVKKRLINRIRLDVIFFHKEKIIVLLNSLLSGSKSKLKHKSNCHISTIWSTEENERAKIQIRIGISSTNTVFCQRRTQDLAWILLTSMIRVTRASPR